MGAAMEIKQAKNSNRIRFNFGEEELDYGLEDSSGGRSFSVRYEDISRDRQTLIERNQWLRNAGLLWLAIGTVLTALSFASEKGPHFSIWLAIGAACYVIYRVRSTHFTVVPTRHGNIFVIDDSEGSIVLDEITKRRAAHLRREYDFIPTNDSPDQCRSRFRWLHREGALTDEDLTQRLAAVDAMDPAFSTPVTLESGRRLN